MENKKIVSGVVVCLVIVVLSFYGGMVFGRSKNPTSQFSSRQGNFSQNGMSRSTIGMRGMAGGGILSGEVLSMDPKSITIKLRDGGSKIVFFSPSTKIEKTVDSTISDVSVSKTVLINGTPNPDGSINATSIQVR